MIKAIRHIGIVVDNLEASLHFYQDLLGFEMTKRMEESGEYIDNMSALTDVQVTTIKMAAPDGHLIELLHYKSHPRSQNLQKEICAIGISHLAFTVENLDEEYAYLSKAGVPFNAPPQLSPDGYAKVTFCGAPEGTRIELVQLL